MKTGRDGPRFSNIPDTGCPSCPTDAVCASGHTDLVVATTVLIVDDSAEVRAGLCEWFRGQVRNCKVSEAASGEEAIQLAASSPPHLVVMDVQLPGMNGLEATRRLKAAHPGVPVIIITLHDTQEHRNAAAIAGASAFVSKHRLPQDLSEAVWHLLPTSARSGEGL